MNQQDRQAIEELFQHLYKWAAEAGPRDPEAEALIQQRFQQGPPGEPSRVPVCPQRPPACSGG